MPLVWLMWGQQTLTRGGVGQASPESRLSKSCYEEGHCSFVSDGDAPAHVSNISKESLLLATCLISPQGLEANMRHYELLAGSPVS